MSATTHQLLAVSALIGECESLTEKGNLNPHQEASLRLLVAKTLAAFAMPSKAELEPELSHCDQKAFNTVFGNGNST